MPSRLREGVDIASLKLGDEPLFSVLPDLFSPEAGLWRENIRTIDKLDGELRISMETMGWLPQLPAIQDENGVVLVGHRRLAIAQELGISPVVETVRFGDGVAGDAARAALAIASNVGAEKISSADRRKIAADLYGAGWSMAKIGDTLKVATMTISRDLRGLTGLNHRPERGGRPRKEPEPAPAMAPIEPEPDCDGGILDDARVSVDAEIEPGERDDIEQAARVEVTTIDWDTIPGNQRDKLERAKALIRRETEVEFRARAAAEVQRAKTRLLAELAEHKADLDGRDARLRASRDAERETYNRYIEVARAKGLITPDDYNTIRACLHPDNSASTEKRAQAFRVFNDPKIRALLVKEKPTPFKAPVPPTMPPRKTGRRSAS